MSIGDREAGSILRTTQPSDTATVIFLRLITVHLFGPVVTVKNTFTNTATLLFSLSILPKDSSTLSQHFQSSSHHIYKLRSLQASFTHS